MTRKAPSAGRPIHPMLVGFPIVLFVATIGLELAHIATQSAFYFRAAMIALGVFGLVAMTCAGALARNLHVGTRPSFASRIFGTAFHH